MSSRPNYLIAEHQELRKRGKDCRLCRLRGAGEDTEGQKIFEQLSLLFLATRFTCTRSFLSVLDGDFIVFGSIVDDSTIERVHACQYFATHVDGNMLSSLGIFPKCPSLIVDLPIIPLSHILLSSLANMRSARLVAVELA